MIVKPQGPDAASPSLPHSKKKQFLQYTATDLPVAISFTHIKRVAWIQEYDKALEGRIN